MNNYLILEKETETLLTKRFIFTKDGFSFWAFIFGFFWALYNKLWFVATILFLLGLIIAFAGKNNLLSSDLSNIMQIIIALISGCFANDWIRSSFVRSGYNCKYVVLAQDEIQAKQRFFDRHNDILHYSYPSKMQENQKFPLVTESNNTIYHN